VDTRQDSRQRQLVGAHPEGHESGHERSNDARLRAGSLDGLLDSGWPASRAWVRECPNAVKARPLLLVHADILA
jgi:hypothetical protein